jgi:hypothetical protein
MTRVASPLGEQQAMWIRPLGLLADEPSGLSDAWLKIHDMWADTVERSRRVPVHLLDERVNDEWSFLETLRHLIFVTDAWIGDIVLELPAPYDPMGLPPDFVTNGSELGLDPDLAPSFDEVLRSREQRMNLVGDVIARTTPDDLNRTCTPRGRRFTTLGAIQNVIFEEWAHNRYAMRDLDALDR